ncbi:MAG TPA: hypothetical protein VKB31_10160 [Trueperaceae bacterium]|nr:hypothetical protein [Trueperaceae bacterium]
MRELRPQREPPAAWPAGLVLLVVVGVAGVLLWTVPVRLPGA